MSGLLMCNLLRSSVNAYLLSVAAYALKLHLAVNQRKQRVVGASADVVSGVDMSSALSYENVSREYKLSVCALNAETLGLGIASVLGRAHSLFMCEKLQINSNHRFFLLKL